MCTGHFDRGELSLKLLGWSTVKSGQNYAYKHAPYLITVVADHTIHTHQREKERINKPKRVFQTERIAHTQRMHLEVKETQKCNYEFPVLM